MSPLAIVLFADALSAIEVCWSLHDEGFTVVAIRKQGHRCPLKYSRFVETIAIPDPEVDFVSSGKALLETAKNLSIAFANQKTVLVPLDDASVLLCSSIQLPCTMKQASPEASIAEIAIDKWKQIKIAEEAGFNVIPTDIIDEECDLKSIMTPCILKPRYAIEKNNKGIAKRSFFNCPETSDLEEVAKVVATDASHLVQPFIRGNGEGLFGIASKDRIYILSAHKRIRMMNPSGSGSSACANKEIEPDLEQASKKFVEIARWSGIFMIELIRDDKGKVWFMEFNGRPWGSMALARRIGLEFPAWHAKLALGIPLPFISRPNFSPITCRHVGREIVHLLYVLRGPRKKVNIKWPSKWGTFYRILCPRKNQHWYNFRRNDLLPFFVDTIGTIVRSICKGLKS